MKRKIGPVEYTGRWLFIIVLALLATVLLYCVTIVPVTIQAKRLALAKAELDKFALDLSALSTNDAKKRCGVGIYKERGYSYRCYVVPIDPELRKFELVIHQYAGGAKEHSRQYLQQTQIELKS